MAASDGTRLELRPLAGDLRYAVWRNGEPGPRIVAAFAELEHAEWACALYRERFRHEVAAYLVADLAEHGGGTLVALLAWEVRE